MRNRTYKTKKFAHFARQLKQKGLWNKFRLLEYYFQVYKNPYSDTKYIMESLESKYSSIISNYGWEYTCFKEDEFGEIEIRDFFRHFEIN